MKTVRSRLRHTLVATVLLLSGAVRAQEPEMTPPPLAGAAPALPAKPTPRPKPRQKPARAETPTPELRSAADEPRPAQAVETSPSQSAFAAPLVACDPGQSVLYDGPKDFSVWVNRIGTVTIDNPLRPLTPDVTRVLQLVIGTKLATAYGRDLTTLRRGASPAALEGLLGGPIRWEAGLGSLPDSFEIVSDSGAPLAQMRFKECGTAPAVKAPPASVVRKEKSKPARKAAPATDPALSPPPASLGRPATAAPAAPQRQFQLPQGAISE